MREFKLVFLLEDVSVSGDVEDVEADEERGGEEADTEQHIAVHQREPGLVVLLLLRTLSSIAAGLYNHRN